MDLVSFTAGVLLWPMFGILRTKMIRLFYLVFVLMMIISAECCGPGKTGLTSKRRPSKKYRFLPLVFRQHEPNVSELAFKGSGPPQGKISRKSPRFREELVRVRNPDILFRNDKKSQMDRYLTQRCKEKLEILSIKVQNYWPGIQLQVTAGFTEHTGFLSKSPKQALHYEGRAVDIRTSDRDRTKYGILGRLAVEAGFDWVHYESKAHIHCSCRSENDNAMLRELKGCFHANSSRVFRKPARALNKPESVLMADLRIGDYVLATDSDGEFLYSEIIAWLDKDFYTRTLFYKIKSQNGFVLTLTPSHLIPVKNPETGEFAARYAGDLSVGDIVITTNEHRVWDSEERKIISIKQIISTGTLAPLTRHGTIVVNKVVASCYAGIKDADLAHSAFAPLRWWTSTAGFSKGLPEDEGVHPFAKFLYSVAKLVLPDGFFFSEDEDP